LLFGLAVAPGDDGRLEDINGYVINWGSSTSKQSLRFSPTHNTITSFSAARAHPLIPLAQLSRTVPDSERTLNLTPSHRISLSLQVNSSCSPLNEQQSVSKIFVDSSVCHNELRATSNEYPRDPFIRLSPFIFCHNALIWIRSPHGN